MKFMKKSALETQELIAEEEKNKLIDSEHWYLKISKAEEKQNKIIVEKSYSLFNSEIYGRLSFQGFNPEIEKLMQNKANGSNLDVKENNGEIIAEEDKAFAEYYEKNYNRSTYKKRRNHKKNLSNKKISY